MDAHSTKDPCADGWMPCGVEAEPCIGDLVESVDGERVIVAEVNHCEASEYFPDRYPADTVYCGPRPGSTYGSFCSSRRVARVWRRVDHAPEVAAWLKIHSDYRERVESEEKRALERATAAIAKVMEAPEDERLATEQRRQNKAAADLVWAYVKAPPEVKQRLAACLRAGDQREIDSWWCDLAELGFDVDTPRRAVTL